MKRFTNMWGDMTHIHAQIPMQTHTHTHTHTDRDARAHTHTHTHTHSDLCWRKHSTSRHIYLETDVEKKWLHQNTRTFPAAGLIFCCTAESSVITDGSVCSNCHQAEQLNIISSMPSLMWSRYESKAPGGCWLHWHFRGENTWASHAACCCQSHVSMSWFTRHCWKC